MRLAITLVVLLAGCTDSSSSSGPGVTGQVEYHNVLASDGGACVEGTLADLDPNTPGPQYDCSVSEVAADQSETILPQCNNQTSPLSSTNKPCWAVEVDVVKCTMADHLIVAIVRDTQPAADAHVIIQCVTQ